MRHGFTTRAIVRLVLAILLLACANPVLADFPKPDGFVTDAAHVLDAKSRADLESLVRDTEQQTAAEIAVATVPSLDGMSVEEYANKLFKEWGVGKKSADNGVLVLVAPTERKMRIEVGYGLEGVLPDGLAGEVIRTDFTPAFRNGDYQRGILQGVGRIAGIVKAKHVLTPDEVRALQNDSSGDKPPSLLTIPFFGLFVGLGAFSVGLGLRSKSGFAVLWGALFGGIPMAMSLVPFFNASLMILGPFAIAMFAWGYSKGGSAGWAKTLRGPKGAASTGWVMGSSSSSGSSGGGSSGGGGGFGGGSSGGGGASGSW